MDHLGRRAALLKILAVNLENGHGRGQGTVSLMEIRQVRRFIIMNFQLHQMHAGAVQPFTGKKQPKIRIRKFAPIVMELMNPLCIKSHLWAQGLLNNKDMEYLEENLLKERQCTYFFGNHLESSYIIRKVDQHGAKGVQKFIACLEAEKEHLGHQDLADILRRHASTICVSII